MLKSPTQVARVPLTLAATPTPAAENTAPAAAAAAADFALCSPAATGRGLNTLAPAPHRVPEAAAAMPFQPSPSLVHSLQPQPPRAAASVAAAAASYLYTAYNGARR